MPINLRDIRDAVNSYLDDKLTLSCEIKPVTGSVINVGEEFTYQITVANADAANGGIALENIIWYVHLKTTTANASLQVPASTTMIARKGPLVSDTQLAESNPKDSKTQVSEMYLFPTGPENSLLVGASVSTPFLKGSAWKVSSVSLECKVFATIDIGWLFAQDDIFYSRSPGLKESKLISGAVVIQE